jgi:gamma-glutamyltranspeptidase/glutathione hydrolase
MAAFKLTPEEPLSTTFYGYIVYKPGFWSQGPAMLQALNIMEGFDGKPPLNSADYLHRQVEAMKLAYADRDTYYADPKFSKLNVQELLTKEYAAERRKLIGTRASMKVSEEPIDCKTGRHPALSKITSYKTDEANTTPTYTSAGRASC